MSSEPKPPERATGRDIILAIGQTMEEGLEPLVTRTLAPSLYQVYLHSADYDRLRHVFPEIEAEARSHLDGELVRLNQEAAPAHERLRRFLRRGERATGRFESTDGAWYIRFQEDPNGELAPGDVEVVAELAVGEEPTYGTGTRTHRIISTTRRLGKMETREKVRGAVPPERPLARIHFEDDRGRQTYEMRKPEIVLGRKADDVWVDLDLHTNFDVSREHARIRRHEGRFQIKDLSTYGVEVNGRPIPPSLSVVNGEEKDEEHWVDLPDGARIDLASVMTLHFEVTSA